MSSTNPSILERQPGKGIQVQLALDDAFADGDDQPFQFSTAVARKHFAEKHQATVISIASVGELDTSVSTLCLDGSTSGTKSDSVSFASCNSQSHTPVEQESSHDLSIIPLSEPEKQADHHANVLHERDYNMEEPAHPTVHIDVSKPPSSRVSVMTQIGSSTPTSDRAHNLEAHSPTPSAPDLPPMTASSSPDSQVSVPPPQSHRPPRSTGPTALQKVMSRTRPHFLPPKDPQEDLKHLAGWQAMMNQSRAAGDTFQLTILSSF